MSTEYTRGHAEAWALRWSLNGWHPGKYVVTVHAEGFFSRNFCAVVDDFGNLVKVEA